MKILEPAVRSLSRRFEIVAKQTIIVGEVTDESGVYEVFVNGAEVRLGADGRFEKTMLLGYGDNQFTVIATDTKGNTAKETFTIVRQSGSSQNSPLLVGEGPGERSKDTTPPEIAIIEPAVRGTNRSIEVVERVKQTNIVVKATDESGVYEVLVNGAEARPTGEDQFRAEVVLAHGENAITVKATDTKMNTATETFTIIVEPKRVTGRSYYALIIAVQDYTEESVHDLNFPLQDAENLIKVLTAEYTFDNANVRFLKDPDRRTILKAFSSLESELTENDNLLVFYSGHGYWDKSLEQGYWLPADATKTDRADWLSNATIRDHVRGIKTRHTLLISDACFSGSIFKARNAFTDFDQASVEKLYARPSRRAITSGAMETVPDRSVFLKYLVKHLSRNREKYQFAERLYVDIKLAVIGNSEHVPQYGTIFKAGDEGGDFIFTRRRSFFLCGHVINTPSNQNARVKC